MKTAVFDQGGSYTVEFTQDQAHAGLIVGRGAGINFTFDLGAHHYDVETITIGGNVGDSASLTFKGAEEIGVGGHARTREPEQVHATALMTVGRGGVLNITDRAGTKVPGLTALDGGRVTIRDGGRLASEMASIDGRAEIVSQGSSWQSDRLTVGAGAEGSLEVGYQTTAEIRDMVLGAQPGGLLTSPAAGTLHVKGTYSGGMLDVGLEGTGNVQVFRQGQLNVGELFVARRDGSSGSASVGNNTPPPSPGAIAVLDARLIDIGTEGEGKLDVQGAGKVTASEMFVGTLDPDAEGEVQVAAFSMASGPEWNWSFCRSASWARAR